MKGYVGRQILGHPTRLGIIRYAGAVSAVMVGTLLAFWLQSVLDASVVLLLAILVAAWFSGFWPALLASVVATLAFDFFFTPPLYTLTPEIAHIPRLIVFTIVAGIFVGISAGRSRAERSLKQARDDLDVKVRERTAELTRVNEALREQANLLDLTRDTIFVRDMNDVIRYWNRGAEELYGWTRDEAVGKVSHQLMHTVFPAPLDNINAGLFESGQWEGELVHTRRDGSHVIVASRWALQRDPDGRAAAILESNNDITARKHAEDALREQARLLDLTHDTIFVRDMNDIIRYWNRGAEELYGWTRDEAVGQVSHRLTQTVFPAPLDAINAELLQRGRWDGELVHTKRDGSRVVVASRWSLQHGVDGRPAAILETNNDITERKRTEAELRESERRHRHIFQATGVSIWEEDFSAVKAAIEQLKRSGVNDLREHLRSSPEFIDFAISLVRVVDVNEATLKLFGASTKEALIGSLHKVFTPDTRDVFAGELIAIAEGHTSFEGETVMRRLNGDRMVVLFSVSFPPPDAAFDAVLVSIMDITDRKRAEQELEELAGRLIHAQEHERSRIGRELHDHISQMLGVLTIRIDQLRADDGTPAAVAAVLGELRESASEITDDIHGLSHRLHSSALDYLGLVPALQKLVNEFSTRHGIAIDFQHGSLPAPLPSDVALCLFRVTEESLTNMAKHSQATSARVAVNSGGDGIHLTVEDSGRGFDPDSLTGKAGLGFVSMRERLRVVRGTVRVDSAPGRGTRIAAWVPAASLAPSQAQSVHPALSSERASSNVSPA